MLVAQRSWHWRSLSRCSMSLVIEMKRENRSIKWPAFKLCRIYWLCSFSLTPYALLRWLLLVGETCSGKWATARREAGRPGAAVPGVAESGVTERLNWNMRVRLRSIVWQPTCPVLRAQTAGFVGVLAISYNETVKGKLPQSLRKHFFSFCVGDLWSICLLLLFFNLEI